LGESIRRIETLAGERALEHAQGSEMHGSL
jgi:hypothetical protein